MPLYRKGFSYFPERPFFVLCILSYSFQTKEETKLEKNNIFDSEKALELLEEKKLGLLKAMLNDAEPADIASFFKELDTEQYPLVFRILPKETAAEAFVEMDADMRRLLIESFNDVELRRVLSELYMDDTVDLVEEMPANVVTRILKNSGSEARAMINEMMAYPDTSAGSIMTVEYVDLKAQMTVDEAFEYIRHVGVDRETIYTCYVTDTNRHLIGLVTAQTLMLSNRSEIIGDIMEKNVISVTTLDDREYSAQLMKKYDFLALPVVDKETRLVGIITFDDADDVITEETEEDFAKMAAITPTEKSYLRSSVFDIWKTRIPWLMLLMISATFTGMIITSFEKALAAQVALTAFIPMLMDTGGNSGAQASVTVIRGISLGEIKFKDIFKVIFKELRVSLMCGIALAIVSFGKIMIFDGMIMGGDITPIIALVVCLTLLLTVVIAKLIGCTLPIIAKKIGFDPAVMASPFITTIVDALSLLVYFGMAGMLLDI